MDESTTQRRLSRRTVAKGAAWTVPAIAVVSPTPAMAASPGIVTLTGENCKLPGNSTPFNNGAVFLAMIANSTNAQIEIVITSFVRGSESQTGGQISIVKLSSSPPGDCCTLLGNSITLPANSTGEYAILTQEWSNSASNDVSVEFTVDGIGQAPATGTAGSLNPIPEGGTGCGSGGSCTQITVAERACIMTALGACETGTCI